MDTKKLRQKILDLAIHGKLVPQDPNDEPASILLERICKEKEQLIKEGKIKAPKKSKSAGDTSHYPKEGPWKLPEGWIWCNLDELCLFLSRGKSPVYSNNDKEYPVFAQKCNLKEGGISLEKSLFLDPATLPKWPIEFRLKTGDVLVNSTGTGTVGRTRLFDEQVLGPYPFVVPDSHVSVIRTFNQISSEYVYIILSSEFGQQYFADNLAGSTNQKELYIAAIAELQFPLPPAEEQRRIAKQVFALNNSIKKLDEEKLLIHSGVESAKVKILDLAIHGKLVPQNPSDEPAIKLLKRINPGFQPSHNLHYDEVFPDGWELVPLSSICTTINGLWKGVKEPLVNVGVIRNANFTKEFTLDYSKIEYIDVELKSFEKRNLEDGDIIVEKSGGSDNFPVGRSVLYQGEDNVYSFSNFTMSLRIADKQQIHPKYLYYALQQRYRHGDMKQMQTQTTGLHNLLTDIYLSMLIPIPPVKEQKRIVGAIEELFRILDGIRDIVNSAK